MTEEDGTVEFRKRAELDVLYPEPQKGIMYDSPELLMMKLIADHDPAGAAALFPDKRQFSDAAPAVDTPYRRFDGKDRIRAFAEGFLEKTAGTLTPNEVDTMALSCFALTAELAVRFLDDYIQGDPYFKINYPEHNLVRTRCQIALAKDMLAKMPQMDKIVRDCVAAAK